MSIELTSPSPSPSHYRSRLSAARRPPSRWSTARRARVLFASTVRIPPLSDCRCARRKIFRVLGLREAEAPVDRPARATDDRGRIGGAREVHLECVWDMFARVIIASRRRAIPGRRSIGPPRVLSRASSSFRHLSGGEKRSTRPRTPAPLVASTHRDPRIEPNADLPRFPRTSQAPPLSSSSPRLSSSRRWSPSSCSVASASRTSTFAFA